MPVSGAMPGAAEGLNGPHLFPLSPPGAKHPFMHLTLTLAALAAAVAGERRWRALIAACALGALVFGAGAAYLPPSGLAWGLFLPTASWTLRDPAGVFAVMSGAFAAAALLQTSRVWARTRHRRRDGARFSTVARVYRHAAPASA